MSAVAIIPAKGSSSRIPGKNRKMFHGKPIIAYSIEAAKACGLFGDAIYVSTDSPGIMEIAKAYGARVILRPKALTRDESGTQEVAAHALGVVAFERAEYACCIYATAPMLLPDDLRMGLAALGDRPFAYVPGIYYWGKTEAFLSGVSLSEGVEVPFPAGRYIDINTPEDWEKAQRMFAELVQKRNDQSSYGYQRGNVESL